MYIFALIYKLIHIIFLQQLIKNFEKLGHKTSRYRDRGSIICALATKNNKIYANADYRKGGEVYGID